MNKVQVDGYTKVGDLLDKGVDVECPVTFVDYYKSIKEFYCFHEVWRMVGRYIHLYVNKNDFDDWRVLVDDDIPEDEFQILVSLTQKLETWLTQRFEFDEDE